MAVVSMAPDRPYVTESIVNLDPPNTYGRLASGNQPLRIVSSDASKYTIATIENTGMMFAELQAGRELTQKNPRINFDFEAVNLLSWQNKFFVIGHTRSATASTGMIAQIQFSNLTDPSSDFDVQTRSLDFLSRVDFATSNESHLYLASRATDSAAPNTTIYALNAALELEHTYSVSGQVTALAALEQDHLVASTYNPDLDQDSIYTFATSVAGDVGNNTRAIKGLRIRNLLPQAARSRIFVGYEIVAGLIAEQTGAIGVLEISGNGEMELRAPFVSTKGGPVNFLSLSVDEKTLYSVASYSNWIHSFVLYE